MSAVTSGNKSVTFDRSDGKKLGVVIADAPGPDQYMFFQTVKPGSQADGKVAAGEKVLTINGVSTKGMTMKQAVPVITKSTTLVMEVL